MIYLALAANVLAFAFVGATYLIDRAAIKRRREAEHAARLATQAKLAELRKERQDRERRHAKRSDLNREIALLTARSLKP